MDLATFPRCIDALDVLQRSTEGQLLTGEHDEMLQAIRDRDVARADALAHAHTRQFRDHFLDYLRANSGEGLPLPGLPSS